MKLSFGNSGKLVLAVAVAFALSLASHARAADTGKITGKVTGKDGNAVAGVHVRLMTPPKKGEKPAKGERPKPVAESKTESDGTYTLSDVPAGDYILVAGGAGKREKGAAKDASAKDAGMAREKVSVKAGETKTMDLKLGDRKEGGKKGKDAKDAK
jgi:hypothetical protein